MPNPKKRSAPTLLTGLHRWLGRFICARWGHVSWAYRTYELLRVREDCSRCGVSLYQYSPHTGQVDWDLNDHPDA